MRALVADPSRPQAVRLAEVAEPVAGPGQVLVEVHHASLNYGDLNDARSGRVPPGAVLGSDVAGVVLQAGDGGPAPGSRVVALAPGAFGERVVAEAGSLAEVPATVGLAQAAGLAEAGADEVVVGLQGIGRPVDVVLDSVGGPHLVAAWQLLAPGGSLQSIGWASGEPAVFPPYSTIGPPKSLTSFLIERAVAAELDSLVRLVEKGHLTVEIGWRGSLDRFADAARALRGRRVNGKAILDVAP